LCHLFGFAGWLEPDVSFWAHVYYYLMFIVLEHFVSCYRYEGWQSCVVLKANFAAGILMLSFSPKMEIVFFLNS